jgi:hypothetical protein
MHTKLFSMVFILVVVRFKIQKAFHIHIWKKKNYTLFYFTKKKLDVHQGWIQLYPILENVLILPSEKKIFFALFGSKSESTPDVRPQLNQPKIDLLISQWVLVQYMHIFNHVSLFCFVAWGFGRKSKAIFENGRECS